MALSATHAILVRMSRVRWTFLGAFLGVFFLTLSGLYAVGYVPSFLLSLTAPEPVSPGPVATSTTNVTQPAIGPVYPLGEGEAPIGIEIPEVGVKANVSNPNTTDVEQLDAALLKGAVRYPTSAKLGAPGNVIIFGHSSHLPIVHNQAFKAFNEISKLKQDDPIYVYSAGKKYTYQVDTVTEQNTATGAIPLTTTGSTLTLATCDNFGEKSDRFVVTATLVEVTDAPATSS
jgi:LPXTG-site transpeptidase (sortase) family protein